MAFDNDVAVLEIAQPCSSLKNAWKNTIEPASRKSAIGCEGWTTVIRHILTVLLRTRHHGERRHPANCRNELAPPHSGTRSVVVQARRIPVLDRHRTGCCITTGAARGVTLRVKLSQSSRLPISPFCLRQWTSFAEAGQADHAGRRRSQFSTIRHESHTGFEELDMVVTWDTGISVECELFCKSILRARRSRSASAGRMR